jgi:hypothetical protein
MIVSQDEICAIIAEVICGGFEIIPGGSKIRASRKT